MFHNYVSDHQKNRSTLIRKRFIHAEDILGKDFFSRNKWMFIKCVFKLDDKIEEVINLKYVYNTKCAYLSNDIDMGKMKIYYQQAYEYYFRKLKFDLQCIKCTHFSTKFSDDFNLNDNPVTLDFPAKKLIAMDLDDLNNATKYQKKLLKNILVRLVGHQYRKVIDGYQKLIKFRNSERKAIQKFDKICYNTEYWNIWYVWRDLITYTKGRQNIENDLTILKRNQIAQYIKNIAYQKIIYSMKKLWTSKNEIVDKETIAKIKKDSLITKFINNLFD